MSKSKVINGQEGIFANRLLGAEDLPASAEGMDNAKSIDLSSHLTYGGAMRLSRLDATIEVSGTDASAESIEILPAGVLVMGASTVVISKSSGCASATMDVGVETTDEDAFADGVAIAAESTFTAMVDGNSSYGIPVINASAKTIKVTPNTAPTAGESFKVHVTVWYFQEIPSFKTENM